MSMTRRLIFSLIAVAVLFWLAAAALAAFAMRDEYREVFDSGLMETAQRLTPLVVDNLYQGPAQPGPRQMAGATAAHREYLVYQVRDATGRVVLHSHDTNDVPFAAPLVQGFFETATHRIYTEVALNGTLFVQVADPLAHRREAAVESATSLFLPVLPLAPASFVVIWLVTRRALRPLDAFRREIAARDGANLAAIGSAALPSELSAIAGSVNNLLARLGQAIDAERKFAADAAHELRTPVAGALVQVQRLGYELADDKAKARARDIEASLTRLGRVVERLLQLARADAGIGRAGEPAELIALIRLVAADFDRDPDHAGRLKVVVEPDAELVRNLDPDAFAIVMRNLIDNAFRHGDQQGTVAVSVAASGDISVTNSGPPVPPDILARLGKRFERASRPATGSGLGLSIAGELATQMGGALVFLSPASGRADGFEARLVV